MILNNVWYPVYYLNGFLLGVAFCVIVAVITMGGDDFDDGTPT